MLRYFLYSPMLFVTFGLGLFTATVTTYFERGNESPQPQTASVEQNPKYYDFFSLHDGGSTKNESVSPPQNLDVRKTFCTDKKVRPIWNAIRRDREIKEFLDYTTESPDCKDMFEIKYLDLNRDGRKEILVRSKLIVFCGAVGNCDFWIFENRQGKLRSLLHGDDYVDITEMGGQVLRSRTNGYSDILLKGHMNASDTEYDTYRFNGKRYIATKCRYHVPKETGDDETTWEFISCKEYARRNDL